MSERPETMPENDVVDLLLRQHALIRDYFSEVENTSAGERRRDAFDRLRRLLAVHETAEEEVVHPMARSALSGGDQLIDRRLAEEHQAKQILEDLDATGTDSVDFETKLSTLKTAVLQHAEREEQEEFPQLRTSFRDEQRMAMGVAVKAAEAMAPTHPHAGVESATANLLVGPYAAMVDRTRDVVRQALQRLPGA
jgi:hemerythrin superfamily protein